MYSCNILRYIPALSDLVLENSRIFISVIVCNLLKNKVIKKEKEFTKNGTMSVTLGTFKFCSKNRDVPPKSGRLVALHTRFFIKKIIKVINIIFYYNSYGNYDPDVRTRQAK